MSQTAGNSPGVGNIRTLVMSGALTDLRLALIATDQKERLDLLARFERAATMVNWKQLEAELREVVR